MQWVMCIPSENLRSSTSFFFFVMYQNHKAEVQNRCHLKAMRLRARHESELPSRPQQNSLRAKSPQRASAPNWDSDFYDL